MGASGGPPQPSPGDGGPTRVITPADADEARIASDCPTCGTVFSGAARFCPFDGEPLRRLPEWRPEGDPLIGRELAGRYRIERVLGEGGMGKVYAARHVTIDRKCAVKVLRRELALERETVERFLEEAKITARLEHPHVVSVTDFGELDERELPGLGDTKLPWFVMDLLEGESLAERLRREKLLDPAEVAAIGRACAEGLACAHGHGVVHRDLKPDNVFLARREDGASRVVLLDFGVAQVASGSRRTRKGMTFGTPHYMSPEQATAGALDGRSDQYALGVILYECLAGEVPFADETFMGVLTKHLVAAPVPLERVVDPSRLGQLGAIVARCLEKKPEARHADAAELAEALAAEEAGAPGAGPPRDQPAELERRKRDALFARAPIERALPEVVDDGRRVRVRRVAWGVVGALSLAAGGALVMGLRAPSAPPALDRPVQAAAAASASLPEAAPAPSAPVVSAAPPPAPVVLPPVTSGEPPVAARPPGGRSGRPATAEGAAPRASAPQPEVSPPRPRGGGEVKDPWAD